MSLMTSLLRFFVSWVLTLVILLDMAWGWRHTNKNTSSPWVRASNYILLTWSA